MTAIPIGRRTAMPGLIDDGLLSGQHEAATVLRPSRPARPIDADDLPAALVEMEYACQVWGGAGQPLLPVRDGRLPAPYIRLLNTEQIDHVGGSKNITVDVPPKMEMHPPWDHPALLVAARETLDHWRTVQIVDLELTDPWRPIYDALLGRWPHVPDPSLSDLAGLRSDLRFEDIVPVQRVSTTGSLGDLIERLTDRAHATPRIVSNIDMSHGLHPDTSFMGPSESSLPRPNEAKRAAGPNIIVIMSPGSVEDVALLWNLRGAHGGGRVMPIGVPLGHLNATSLRELHQPGRATMFGFGGGDCYLVSASLDLTELEALIADYPSAHAVAYDQLLTFGPPPGRRRIHVSTWHEGQTRLEPLSEADREVLGPSTTALRQPSLVLDVTVDGIYLPADATMRGRPFLGSFQAGAAQVPISDLRRSGTVEVTWPTSWTCLTAVASTRRLEVQQSEPGLAAVTLIRTLGGISNIALLCHRPLINLLYKMAERSGMAYQKRKWAEVHQRLLEAVTDPSYLERVESVLGRDEIDVAPAGEGRAVPFQDFVRTLGGEPAARNWVTWAERRHLLVRGAEITCPDCRTKSWLPMGALPPPVPCPGCGRQISQPYGPRSLTFTYRLGEPLRRVLETDSLGHVLALRWFVELFDRRGLVGAHPGVTFTKSTDGGVTLGEADVLLLFADGSMVPIEVKRRLAGVDDRTVSLMDALSEALNAPWDALVVTEPARDVASLPDAARARPDRPRVILTDDQLLEEHVVWLMARDPFGWDPRPAEQDTQRDTNFAKRLAAGDPDVPWDRVRDALMFNESTVED